MAGEGRSRRLLAMGDALGVAALPLDSWRNPCFAGKLAKVGVGERGKLRNLHRGPAAAQRGQHGGDVLLFGRLKRGLCAAQSPGCRLDGFVLIHSEDHTVIRLRCHGLCDSVNDMRNQTPQAIAYPCPLCRGTRKIYGYGWEQYHESVRRWKQALAEAPDERLAQFVAETEADKPTHDAEFRECPRCRGIGTLSAPDLCGGHDYEDPQPAMYIVMQDFGTEPGTSKTRREPSLVCARHARDALKWRTERHPGEPPMVFALRPLILGDLPDDEVA